MNTPSNVKPDNTILNELAKWLTKINLSAQPAAVSIDTSMSVSPKQDALNQIFTITVSRKIERVDGEKPH
jgi:hypothetical protein